MSERDTPAARDNKRSAGPSQTIRQPVMPGQRAEVFGQKRRRSCTECIFCVFNLLLWTRTLRSGLPVRGQCANHPDTPGQIVPVPGFACRNFRAKPHRVAPPQPPNDKVRYIPLTRGLHTIVDAEDYEWLSKYKWYAGSPKSSGTMYARRYGPGGVILMHRMIVNPPKGMVVHHINGNGLDNRRCNLEICTQKENLQSRGKAACGQSRFIGVSPCGNKWQATCRGEYLGLFDNEQEAAKVRDRRAREVYGQRAWLNFPPEDAEPEGQ
jgi:hypothetical protein